jgi:signal transduction histidine kinase
MPNGGELKIEANPVAANASDGSKQHFIKVVVSDTGKGIPSPIVNRVFDPFFTTKSKGIGLGLSITYQIIKKHGGTIKVESKWESGTSFIINLPENLESL